MIEETPYGPMSTEPCPTCGLPWSIGHDADHPGAGALLRELLGECSECRGAGDEPTLSLHLVDDFAPAPRNRAERRAARRGRR